MLIKYVIFLPTLAHFAKQNPVSIDHWVSTYLYFAFPHLDNGVKETVISSQPHLPILCTYISYPWTYTYSIPGMSSGRHSSHVHTKLSTCTEVKWPPRWTQASCPRMRDFSLNAHPEQSCRIYGEVTMDREGCAPLGQPPERGGGSVSKRVSAGSHGSSLQEGFQKEGKNQILS